MEICNLTQEILVLLRFYLNLLDKVIDRLGITLFEKLQIFLLQTLESLLEL